MKNWLLKKLGEVADFTNGGAWTPDEYVESGIPVVRVSDIQNETINLQQCKYLLPESISKYKKHTLFQGDLVIATVGSHPTQPGSVVGRPGIVPQYVQGALLNQNAVRIAPANNYLDKKYLAYLGKSQFFRNYIIRHARGSANQVRMSIGLLKEMEVLLPPLPIQRKIAAILSAYDRLIENNTRRIEILEEMARSIYREWFVKFRFPGHEQVQMVDSELGLIPEGWEALPIDELIKRGILEKNQDGNHGEKHPKSTDYVASGIPFIMAKDLSNNIIDLENCQFISYKQAQSLRVGFAKTGDVLLTHKATMGRVALVPQVEKFIVLTPQVTYFRIKDYSLLNQAFLYCTFTSDRFQDILSGQSDQSTRKFISITNQRNIKILYPSPSWINKFGEIIKDVLGLKESLYSKNANLRQTRDLLLPRLISGEIDVENLEINTGLIAA